MKLPGASVVRTVRRRGLRATARQSLAELRNELLPNATHVWYLLDLQAERPKPVVPAGYVVEEVLPGSAEVALLGVLGPNAEAEAQTRFTQGGRLFIARADDALAFACWVFRAIPTLAARSGWYRVRDDARGLEYSITVEAHRGHGLAPAVWSQLSDLLEAEGVTGLLTKVGLTNEASRKAVAKSGFVEIAHVTVRRRRGRIRVDVTLATGPDGARLERELAR
jgi:GNAT superfamily N-acetyltransferase